MEVEENNGNTTNHRDSSLPEVKLNNLSLKQDFNSKSVEAFSRNSNKFVFPHLQNGHSNSFRQSPIPRNIFQSPTSQPQLQQPQPQQPHSPNIFQQGSPNNNNNNSNNYIRNLFDQQQPQQFSPSNMHGNQNSRNRPNHQWS
jgi:hypothetical protein